LKPVLPIDEIIKKLEALGKAGRPTMVMEESQVKVYKELEKIEKDRQLVQASMYLRVIAQKITPIAAESFGVRSMCTFVETPDVEFCLMQVSHLHPTVSVFFKSSGLRKDEPFKLTIAKFA
jgi:hypothetical protein